MAPELGFQEHKTSSSSGFIARDASPDSVIIFTPESNFSLCSSASASADRCSFASEAHDFDSIASEISLRLAGHVNDGGEHHESSSGPHRESSPNKPSLGNKHSRLSGKGEEAKAIRKEDSSANIEDENLVLDSARNSFSLILKEYQDQRSRSEALLRKIDQQRPASLDLNNSVVSSSRSGTMKKDVVSSHKSGTFPSPETPNYRHASVGMQKGWSSERVPLHNNGGNRKHVSPALLAFNNGRALPSKWEDAERWILSPVSGDGVLRPSGLQPQRRPKSKSGPLGPPGTAYYSFYSPAMPLCDRGNQRNLIASSPFSEGVIEPEGLAIHSASHRVAFPVQTEPGMARSVSVHGCSELLVNSSSTDGVKDAATNISRSVSRRDMATQMIPEGSPASSPKIRPSTSAPDPSAPDPSALPILELQSVSFSKLEVRDVQVDERVTMTRWSKKHKTRIPGKGYVGVWRKKDKYGSTWSSEWDTSDAAKSISKVQRGEAKITAWENLQKAKAEAAIRKLEVKLEKKRSSSMDKIMNKLRSAQKRAQEMRSSVLADQAHQAARTSLKALSFHRTRPIDSLSGCFTCHAF